MTQVGIPAYKHCAAGTDQPPIECKERLRMKYGDGEFMMLGKMGDLIYDTAADLRKYRLEDPISQHYSIGFYDGLEHALSVIEQQIKGSAA